MADDRECKAAKAKFKKSERATEGHARAFSSSSSIWRIVVAVTFCIEHWRSRNVPKTMESEGALH
jgi:hypothetical protein